MTFQFLLNGTPLEQSEAATLIKTVKNSRSAPTIELSEVFDTSKLDSKSLFELAVDKGSQELASLAWKISVGKSTKPVKRSGKRGKFLQWFLEGEGSRSVREAMAEFGMSRSNALSYLYMLQKDHGIGYELVGDIATIKLPACESPFDDGHVVEGAASAPEAEPEDDDSWLEGEETSADEDDSWLD